MAIFKPADILIPQNVDFAKWSVVACDQYTSEREYWEDVKNIVGDSPSTLNIIFPEVYLEDGDGDERIKKINNTMEEYINQGIFRELKDTFIYVKRTQPNGKTRHGIVGMLDLEEYDFSKGSQSKVRATEGTIIERIPPRKRIRKNAPLEAPHILILIDDREKAVVEPLENQINDFEKIYDFDLMKNSGHIVGYNVNESAKKNILDAIEKLGDKADFEAKYGVKDKGVLMFAAGDGNHSLATAKTCWEEIKKYVEAQLDKQQWTVDYVLSHTCPMVYEPREKYQNLVDAKTIDKSTEQWLDQIAKKLTYKCWYFGHYHDNVAYDDAELLYEEIKELGEKDFLQKLGRPKYRVKECVFFPVKNDGREEDGYGVIEQVHEYGTENQRKEISYHIKGIICGNPDQKMDFPQVKESVIESINELMEK